MRGVVRREMLMRWFMLITIRSFLARHTRALVTERLGRRVLTRLALPVRQASRIRHEQRESPEIFVLDEKTVPRIGELNRRNKYKLLEHLFIAYLIHFINTCLSHVLAYA